MNEAGQVSESVGPPSPRDPGGLITEQSERLIRFLRDPDQFIDSIAEHCEFSKRSMSSTVTVTFSSETAEHASGKVLMDIVHPDRGTPEAVEILHPPGARVLGHDEHTQVAADHISCRIGLVIKSIVERTPQIGPEVVDVIATLLWKLTSIPFQPGQAPDIVAQVFQAETGRVQAIVDLEDAGKLSSEPVTENQLYAVCKRLSTKYYLLVEVPFAPAGDRCLKYRQLKAVSPNQLRRTRRSTAGKARLRDLWFATLPSAFRLHLPLAKRAPHYLLTVNSTTNHFFGKYYLLLQARDMNVPRVAAVDGSLKFQCSLVPSPSGPLQLFLGNARRERDKIFLGLRAFEYPGRSTARSLFATTVFLAALASLFLLQAVAAQPPLGGIFQFVLAILAIGSLFPPILRDSDDDEFGQPLLSQVTPAILALSAIVFAVWLSTASLAPEGDSGVAEANVWSIYGQSVAMLPAATLMAWLVMRHLRLAALYRTAIASRALHNF